MYGSVPGTLLVYLLAGASEHGVPVGTQRAAGVVLPSRADAPFRVEDLGSGLWVEVGPDGAGQGGGEVSLRMTAEGVEDFVTFSGPTEESVRYEIRLGEAVAGLRLVANTLELLDLGGAPRLRAAPPYVLDALGRRRDATLSVDGCAVDTRPAAPWGRPVTPPGGAVCGIRVRWEEEALTFPVVLDPAWWTTGSMAIARASQTATVLADGRVLVAGGGHDYQSSAELYDPATGTWSATAAMGVGREGHTASLLADGRVLVVGGSTAEERSIADVELYDPEAGTWSPTASLSTVRSYHTASVLTDGRVLVAAGRAFLDTDSSELYDPASETWAPGPNLAEGRYGHGAVTLLDGRVLVFGGGSGSVWGGSTASAELFDPNSLVFTPAAPLAEDRAWVSGVLLQDGRVLVSGGRFMAHPVPGGRETTEIYDPSLDAWTFAAMAGFDMPLGVLPDGTVLAPGAYLYDPASDSVELSPSLLVTRDSFSTTVLQGGRVLVAGGVLEDGGTLTAASELYLACPDDAADEDGDGVVCALDCDDAEPSRYPGADEVACDGLDNGCTGEVAADERDADGDGWWPCSGDCDDGEPSRYPGADEVACDGLDNGCSGEVPVDERDADGDGWWPCSGDCDDAEPTLSPEAEEACNGLDDDCDGTVDPDCEDAPPAGHPGAGGCGCGTGGLPVAWLGVVVAALVTRRRRPR